MTRIISGLARGRRLVVPPSGTRPTSDRAREGLFNTLRAHLDLAGANVLDLYAGTGAVGLEALSRGAATVTLVDSDRGAVDVLRRNIAAVGLPGATAVRRTVTAFLSEPAPPAPFELVFADPPYAETDAKVAAVLAALQAPDWLADDAVVVIERSARGAEPAWPPGIALVTQRRYGEGVLWYGRENHER